jgi:hypothetical protein
VLHWAGLLTFPVLVAVGLTIGATFPAHQSSQRLLLAATVADGDARADRGRRDRRSARRRTNAGHPRKGGASRLDEERGPAPADTHG